MAARPTYDSDWYTPANIKNFIAADPKNIKLVRQEYTRLRDIEEKRIKRMAKDPKYSRTQVYKQNAGKYPKLADLKGGQLAYKLSALERFVSAKTSTISGLKAMRKSQLETLSKHGYTFVNEENLTEFGEFMEEFRAQKLDEIYDSGEAADTYYMVERHGLSPSDIEENFNYWLENHQYTKGLKKSTGKYAGSAEKLRRRVEAKKSRTRSTQKRKK